MDGANDEQTDEEYTPPLPPEALPSDDTEPNALGVEPKPCEICELYLSDGDIVQTTNRALFNVNQKWWISPMCPEHDTASTLMAACQLYEYAGYDFLADGIRMGVLTLEEAVTHLPIEGEEDTFSEHADIPHHLDTTYDPDLPASSNEVTEELIERLSDEFLTEHTDTDPT